MLIGLPGTLSWHERPRAWCGLRWKVDGAQTESRFAAAERRLQWMLSTTTDSVSPLRHAWLACARILHEFASASKGSCTRGACYSDPRIWMFAWPHLQDGGRGLFPRSKKSS